MKRFIVYIMIIFLVGCSKSSDRLTIPSEPSFDTTFQDRLLKLDEVSDLDNIIHAIFLEKAPKKNYSVSSTRELKKEGDISGYYVQSKKYDRSIEAYVGEIVFYNYKNSKDGCSKRYEYYDISMSYIQYSDKTIYKMKTNGYINNTFVKKGGTMVVRNQDENKETVTLDITAKTFNISYQLINYTYTVEKSDSYVYTDFIDGKVFVKTAKTNGYFYIKSSPRRLQFDRCDNYIDGRLYLVGKNTVADVTLQNDTYNISVEKKTLSYFDKQWNINKNSIYQKYNLVTQDADINLEEAWQESYGEGVKVAVIDSCFDADHEDLKANIYKTFDVNKQTTDVSGKNCHGTMVAGIIGAVKNNFGITGVAPKVKLILIKINLENSSESDFIEAFEYAKDNGAKVINCSWGSNSKSETLADELKKIKDAGIITVFASGNSNLDMDASYIDDESEDSNVIGVGATDGETNDIAYYSNYGSNIDILAPGGTPEIGLWLLGDNNTYRQEAGTSFASPTIVGVVALMLSKNPNLTFNEIYTKLTQSADKIGGSLADYVNGFDKYRAYGKINAKKALQ